MKEFASALHVFNIFLALVSSFVYDNVDDDWGSDDRSYCIQGDDSRLSWQHTDDVTEQGNYRTCQHGSRHEPPMVVGSQQQPGYVWHRQSDERHWSAEGSGDGGQQSCNP